MEQRLRRYKKDFNYSYAFGVFPTLELLTHKPQDALQVVVHPKGQANSGITKIQALCQKNEIPFETQEQIFPRLKARENDFAVGVFRKNQADLEASANHVILVNPNGMGNIGTICRTMLGFGFYDLAIIEPAADIFHPETVRASMGALFQMRLAHFENIEAYCENYSQNLYSLMTDGSIPLPKAAFQTPFGFIFGNESSGLDPNYHKIGNGVRIPQSQGIDSLNLAISVGVTLYQAAQTINRQPTTNFQ